MKNDAMSRALCALFEAPEPPKAAESLHFYTCFILKFLKVTSGAESMHFLVVSILFDSMLQSLYLRINLQRCKEAEALHDLVVAV